MFTMSQMTDTSRHIDNNPTYEPLWKLFVRKEKPLTSLNLGPGQLHLQMRNPNYINIIWRGSYRGCIHGGGKLKLETRNTGEINVMLQMLNQLNNDPLGVTMACGVKSGTCCVCSRTLTDPESVKRGIGPICEGRMS